MPLILPTRNPLAYPGGAPGFDPSHVAVLGAGTSVSMVAAAAGAVNTLTGIPGAAGGATPTAAIDGAIGPCSVHTAAGASWVSTYGSNPQPAESVLTMACIIRLTNTGTNRLIETSTSTGSGTRLDYSAAFRIVTNAVTAMSSGVAGVADGLYFYAATFNSATSNHVVVNLLTGQTQKTTTTGSAASNANTGGFSFGAAVTGGAAGYRLAAGMFSKKFMSLSELARWAVDPWSFWYPRRPTYNVAAAAAAGFPWWAVNNNPGVIGTGVY